jgi:hypothetical protein
LDRTVIGHRMVHGPVRDGLDCPVHFKPLTQTKGDMRGEGT